MANSLQYISDFYCTHCGALGLPVVRSAKHTREPGHLKKLYCPRCRIQRNMVEVRPFGRYTYEDFQIEFKYGNFDEEGQRGADTRCMIKLSGSWLVFLVAGKLGTLKTN